MLILDFYFLHFISEQSDYSVNGNDFLFFITGSRQGSRACGIVTIINDEMTELSEDFKLNLVSESQIATIEPTQSQLTVLIDDDDRKIK